jgi:hypothetical protein
MQLKQHISLLNLNILAIFFTIIKNFFANKYKDNLKKNASVCFVRKELYLLLVYNNT